MVRALFVFVVSRGVFDTRTRPRDDGLLYLCLLLLLLKVHVRECFLASTDLALLFLLLLFILPFSSSFTCVRIAVIFLVVERMISRSLRSLLGGKGRGREAVFDLMPAYHPVHAFLHFRCIGCRA